MDGTLTVNSHFWKPVVNMDKLWSLVPAEEREAYLSGQKKDTVPVIDLLPLGYSKLLGKGRIPEIPLVVKARWVSKLVRIFFFLSSISHHWFFITACSLANADDRAGGEEDYRGRRRCSTCGVKG